MSNRNMPRQLAQHIIGEDLRHQAHAFDVVHLLPVRARNPRRLLPAMLQRIQAPVRHARRIRMAIHRHHTTLFAQLIERRPVFFLVQIFHRMILQLEKFIHYAVTTSSANCSSSEPAHDPFSATTGSSITFVPLIEISKLPLVTSPSEAIHTLGCSASTVRIASRCSSSVEIITDDPISLKNRSFSANGSVSDTVIDTLKPSSRGKHAFANATADPPSEISVAEASKPCSESATSALCSAASSVRSSTGGVPHSSCSTVFAYSVEPNSRRICRPPP